MEIYVIDNDPFSLSRGGGLTDTSLVEKYKMSEEAYEKRKGTMREYIKEQKAKNPNFKLIPTKETQEKLPSPGIESVEGILVGNRCEIMPGARRGVVKFVGEIDKISAGGYWVGVQLDEPLGHNDGTVKGIQIFECPPNFGVFVRGHNVKVGDFPERDIFDEIDETENKGNSAEEEEDEI